MAGRPLRQARARLAWGLDNRCIGPAEVFGLCAFIDRSQARRNPGDDDDPWLPTAAKSTYEPEEEDEHDDPDDRGFTPGPRGGGPVVLAAFLARYKSWLRSRMRKKSGDPVEQDEWVQNVMFQLNSDFGNERERTVPAWKASVAKLLGKASEGGLEGKRFGPPPDPIWSHEEEDEAKGRRSESGFYPYRRSREQQGLQATDPESGEIYDRAADPDYAITGVGAGASSQRDAGQNWALEKIDQDQRLGLTWDFIFDEASPEVQQALALLWAANIGTLVDHSAAIWTTRMRAAGRLRQQASRTHDLVRRRALEVKAAEQEARAATQKYQARDLEALVDHSEALLKREAPTTQIGVEGYDPYDIQRALGPYGFNATVMASAVNKIQMFMSRRGFFSAEEPRSNPRRARSRRRSRPARRARSSRGRSRR